MQRWCTLLLLTVIVDAGAAPSSSCIPLAADKVALPLAKDQYFDNNRTLLLHTNETDNGIAYINVPVTEQSCSFHISTGLMSNALIFGLMSKSELFNHVLQNHTHIGYNAKWETAVAVENGSSSWTHSGMVEQNQGKRWTAMSGANALHTTCANDATVGCDLHITAQLSLDGRPELIARRSSSSQFVQRIKSPYEVDEEVYLVLSKVWNGAEQAEQHIQLQFLCATFYGCAPAKMIKEQQLGNGGATWTLSHSSHIYSLSVTSRAKTTEDRDGRGALRMIGYPFPNDPPVVSNDFWKTADPIASNDQIVTVVLPFAKQFHTMTLYQDQNQDGDEVEPKKNVINAVEIWAKNSASSTYTMPTQTLKIDQDKIVVSFGDEGIGTGAAAYSHWQARFTNVSSINASVSRRYFIIRRWDILDVSTYWCRARELEKRENVVISTNRFSCRYAKVLFNNQRQTDEINFDQTKVKDSGGAANLEIYGKKAGESKEYLITNVRQKMCASYPCQNGGVCTDGILSQYTCECPVGFDGKNCEQNIDDCADSSGESPCKNGATCQDGINQ